MSKCRGEHICRPICANRFVWRRCRRRFAKKKSIGSFRRPISRRRWADAITRWSCA